MRRGVRQRDAVALSSSSATTIWPHCCSFARLLTRCGGRIDVSVRVGATAQSALGQAMQCWKLQLRIPCC